MIVVESPSAQGPTASWTSVEGSTLEKDAERHPVRKVFDLVFRTFFIAIQYLWWASTVRHWHFGSLWREATKLFSYHWWTIFSEFCFAKTLQP